MSSDKLPIPSVGVIIASLLILAACAHNAMPPAHAEGRDPCESQATSTPGAATNVKAKDGTTRRDQ